MIGSAGHKLMDRNAEQAVRNMLLAAAKSAGSNVLHVSPALTPFGGADLQGKDFLDDGSPICLAITIDEKTVDATFDFTGTGAEVNGNLNAPISVVHSAIIYW